MSKIKDLTGLTFGNWKVIHRAENTKVGQAQWLCECQCDKKTKRVVRGQDLRNGKNKSCGCSKEKHLLSNNKLYPVWSSMKARCNKETHHAYKDYGSRGISVCEEWLNKENGFMNFYNWAMENGYEEHLTIDRIDVNGNYEPSNCRWVDMKEQCNNRRNNSLISLKGETKTLSQWANVIGITCEGLRYRLNQNWGEEEIFGKSKRPRGEKYE